MGFLNNLPGVGANNGYTAPPEMQTLGSQIPGLQTGNQQFIDYLRSQAQQGSPAQQALMQNQGPNYAQTNQIFQQTQGVANQLGDVAAGRGPNPALQQLQQTTDQNIARTRGMIGAERSLNPALAARLGATTGANIQQQANQQGAGLAAQQQLGAMGAQGNLLGQQANLSAGMAQQANAQQLAAKQAAGALGLGSNQLAAQAGLQNQGQVLDATMAQQGINAGVQGQNANINAGTFGGFLSGVGSVLAGGGAGKAFGGEIVPHMAMGGDPTQMMSFLSEGMGAGGATAAGRAEGAGIGKMMGGGGGASAPPAAPLGGADAMAGSAGAGDLASAVPALALAANHGAVVPGKAPIPGKNDMRNDVVDAKLTPGEIVLPLSVTKAPNPAQAAADFVAAIKNKYAEGGEVDDEGAEGYSKVLVAHKKLEKRLEQMEKHFGAKKGDGGKLVYFAGGKVKGSK